MNEKLIEKKISTETLFQGVIFRVERQTVELPNGKKAIRDIVVNPNASAVVAIDDDKNIIMVKQFRATEGKVMLEIPAGKLDAGEDTKECALRELREETGYIAKKIDFLFAPMVSPGFATEHIHIFMATQLELGETEPDEDEFVETLKVPIADVIEMIMNGEIEDSKTVSGVLAAARILKV
ncbi:MAG: NUDIX hydrolase [Eubacteriales bacterium]